MVELRYNKDHLTEKGHTGFVKGLKGHPHLAILPAILLAIRSI